MLPGASPQLHVESLQSQLVIGHEGEHVLKDAPPVRGAPCSAAASKSERAAAKRCGTHPRGTALCVQGVLPSKSAAAHDNGDDSIPVNLYSVLPRSLLLRAPRMVGSLKCVP